MKLRDIKSYVFLFIFTLTISSCIYGAQNETYIED